MAQRAIRLGISWGGLLTGPLAWAISTQANYSLVQWQCGHRVPVIPMLAVLLALLAACGGGLSFRVWTEGGASLWPEREPDTKRFVAAMSTGAAALFALVILMQGSANLILGSCVR